MRKTVIVCLLFLVTGCVAIQPGKDSTQNQAMLFHDSLDQLLQKNNTKPMKTFIKEHPDNIFVNDAKQLLQLHSSANSCGGKLNKCSKQLKASHQDLKKLQDDIDRMTELNLEMDRSS